MIRYVTTDPSIQFENMESLLTKNKKNLEISRRMKLSLFVVFVCAISLVNSQSYSSKPNPKWSRKPRRALRSDEVEVPIVRFCSLSS